MVVMVALVSSLFLPQYIQSLTRINHREPNLLPNTGGNYIYKFTGSGTISLSNLFKEQSTWHISQK